MEADTRMERHRKVINRLKEVRSSSIQRFNDILGISTIKREYVKCGKDVCELSHGPYYYAYCKEKCLTAIPVLYGG